MSTGPILTSEGKLEVLVGKDTEKISIKNQQTLSTHVWYRISVSFSQDNVKLKLNALDSYCNHLNESLIVKCYGASYMPKSNRPLLFSGKLSHTKNKGVSASHIFNGKIENPSFYHCSTNEASGKNSITNAIIAQWDFSKEIPSTNLIDIGPLKMQGYLENLPTRGVTSHAFTGEVISWVQKPEHYSAIHFHDDDLYDAGWDI